MSEERYYKATRPDGRDFYSGKIDYASALADAIFHGSGAYEGPVCRDPACGWSDVPDDERHPVCALPRDASTGTVCSYDEHSVICHATTAPPLTLDWLMARIRHRWPDALVWLTPADVILSTGPRAHARRTREGATDAERLARALLQALEEEK